MKFVDFMMKVERVLELGWLLFEVGDIDGVCNCVYYVMFDVVKVVFLVIDVLLEVIDVKMYSGLIVVFSFYVVKCGFVGVDYGWLFNWFYELCMIVDYCGDSIEEFQIWQVIVDVIVFIVVVEVFVKKG